MGGTGLNDPVGWFAPKQSPGVPASALIELLFRLDGYEQDDEQSGKPVPSVRSSSGISLMIK
jgi:hypothetical protein